MKGITLMNEIKMAMVMMVLLVPVGSPARSAAECRLVNLRPAVYAGFQAELETVPNADEGRPAWQATFVKTGEERRLLALEGQLEASPIGVKALVLRYRLTLTQGEALRPAVVVFDQEGGSWYKVGGTPLEVGGFMDCRLSVAALRPTAFSPSSGRAAPLSRLDWNQVARVWVGVVVDGPAQGSIALSEARFTDEPYRPTQPLRVTGEGVGKWSVSQDPAVQSTLTTPNEGPEGQPCMKYEFTLPGGRHMYAIPHTPVVARDLEGYTALRFTYKATLPEGIKGLLVTLWERGGAQYMADPPPPPSAEWTTITLPLDQFTLGGWTKDDNGQFDLETLTTVAIGCHGTAQGEGGSGTIWATDVELVP